MKTAQLLLGGELRNLDFSRAGLNDHIENAAKKPAFDFLNSLIPEKNSEGGFVDRFYTLSEISVLVYAGINSANDVSGSDYVDFEIIKRWVRSIESDKLNEYFTTIIMALSGDNSGKETSQPEQGSI